MWEEDVESAARRKVAWLIGIVVAVLIAFAGWYWYASRQRPAPATPVVAAAAPPPVSTEPQIAHPITADNAADARAAARGSPRSSTKDRKSTRLNSSHRTTSYADFCLKKKKYRQVGSDR